MTGVLTLGETLGLVGTGRLEHAGTARVGTGGAESNVAIGLRRLGVDAYWVGRVGDDGWGRRVLRDVRAEGVSVHATVDTTRATAVMTAESRLSGRTRVTYLRSGSAGSRLAPGDVPDEVVTLCDAVHLTGITAGLSDSALAAVRHVFDTAGRHDVPVSFDVNHRDGVWRGRDPVPVYRELVARAAVVFAGEDEARLVTGSSTSDHRQLLDELASMTAGDVVLKRGERGAAARLGEEVHDIAAFQVRVRDTVGAGDAFVAGYLAEMVSGRPADHRLRTAAACGALACQTDGDWEGLPTASDLSDFFEPDPVRR